MSEEAAVQVEATPLAVRWQPRAPGRRSVPLELLAPVVDAGAAALAAALVGLPASLAALFAVVVAVLVRPPAARRTLLQPRLADDVLPLLGRLATAAAAVALLPTTPPRTVLLAGAAALPLVLVGRAASAALRRAAYRRGVGLERTAVLGAGPTGLEVAEVLRRHREFGLDPVGFIDEFDPDGSDLPLLGPPKELGRLVLQHRIRRLIVAFGAMREAELVPLLRDLDDLPYDVKVHTLPRFFELGQVAHADDVWGFPLIPLPGSARRRRTWRLKRAFDVTVAATLLLLTAPLFAVLALLVKLSSPGPVFFRQKRIGQFGRHIEILKFRSMRVNDDSDTQWSVEDDDRVTWIGRIMRPTHLDELPQLINVLRGEMSIVGPRPERPVFVDRFTVLVPRYEDRHRVPVGITGWAQVHGLWGDTSIEDRARFDNRYIEDWTLWRDFVILLRTIPTVLTGRKERGAPARIEGP